MTAATPRITSEGVARFLDANLPREPGTKIQYGHPSPRFWETSRASIPELLEPLDKKRPLNLYVHIPFCPPTSPEACGFCLFAREDFQSYGLVDSYMRDLYTELDRVCEHVGRRTLNTIYFGGGTPNLLKVDTIREVFTKLHQLFDIPPDCETTFEGTPALFTLDRLEALDDCGVNRISVGAQVLKPRLIEYSGRKQRPEQIRRTVEFCAERDIHCSVDLITGWFEQTPQDLVDDIELLASWGVTGIVNHPLTLAGDSLFARNKHELPSVDVTCRSFLTGREVLLDLGFRADSYTDYCRSSKPVVKFLQMYREVLHHDRLGVGYGANSLFAGTTDEPGHTFKNVVGLGPYHERLAEGESGLDSIFRFCKEDLRLLYVLKGLEGAPYLTTQGYAAEFGGDLREDFEPWWTALEKRGWLVWKGDQPMLVGPGVFYTASVQRCLAEPRNHVIRVERLAS